MKYTIIKKVIEFFWTRRARFKKLYKEFKNNPNINFDWNISWNEVKEYAKTAYTGLEIRQEDRLVGGSDYTAKLEQLIGENTHKLLVEYTQSINSCAQYGNTRAMMYNTGILLKKSEVESICDYAVEQGYREKDQGMTFIDAAKATEEWMLENKGVRIETIRTPYNGEKYKALKDLWYACALWGGWTDEKTLDIRGDNEIDYDYTWKEKVNFFHCWSEEVQWYFTDNYANSTNNQWKNERFDEFVANWVNFSWCYFPIPVSVEEEEKDKETLINENEILRRRSDDTDKLLQQALKSNKPNDY